MNWFKILAKPLLAASSQVEAWKLSLDCQADQQFLICRVVDYIPLQESLPRTLTKQSRRRHVLHHLTEQHLHLAFWGGLRDEALQQLHPIKRDLLQSFHTSKTPLVLQLPLEFCAFLSPAVGSRAIVPLNHPHMPSGVQFLQPMLLAKINAWRAEDDELRARGNQQDCLSSPLAITVQHFEILYPQTQGPKSLAVFLESHVEST